MNTNCQSIEDEIKAKGLTAPRITPADIEANIASEHYFTALGGVLSELHKGATDEQINAIPSDLGLLTFCVLVLRNGFTVTGESSCASPENFDAEVGRKIALQNAINKIWPLMGYALKEQLHQAFLLPLLTDSDIQAIHDARPGKIVFVSGDNANGSYVRFDKDKKA